MKKYILIMGLIAVTALLGTVALADKEPLQPQTKCPVMGGAVNTNLYMDADGKRVYFCCKGCPAEFKKAPAKFISKLEKEGVTLEKAPAKDPTKKQQAANPEAAPSKGQDDSGKKGCGGCM